MHNRSFSFFFFFLFYTDQMVDKIIRGYDLEAICIPPDLKQ